MLAVGTMPVATRAIDDMELAALLTAVDGCAVMVCAAVDDGVINPALKYTTMMHKQSLDV